MALTSVDNVSVYLQQTIDGSSTPSSTTVSTWIDEVTDEIQHITKQKFEVNTVTDKVLAVNSDNTIASANQFDGTQFYNLPTKRDVIILPHDNIIALTKFEINTASDSETPSWTELTIGYGGDVILDGNRVSFIGTGFVVKSQKVSIRVSYTHGQSTVPDFVQKLATRMVALEYLNSSTASDVADGGGGIRVGDIEIREPGRFTQDYIQSVESWVDKKLKQLGTHLVKVI